MRQIVLQQPPSPFPLSITSPNPYLTTALTAYANTHTLNIRLSGSIRASRQNQTQSDSLSPCWWLTNQYGTNNNMFSR